MKKHEIYKKYDEVFNNKKLNSIKREIRNVNKRQEELDKIYKERIKYFAKYCGAFIDKDEKHLQVSEDRRITKNGGIEEHQSWANKWEPIWKDFYIETQVKKCVPYLTEEGQEIFKKIETLNTSLQQKRVMVNIGKIKAYHKKYFFLPSYSAGRKDYPINIILKRSYGGVAISIPAFHRFPIISYWENQSDAQSLKREMLMVEFYEDIKKHFFPILKEHMKRIKWIKDNNENIISELAKYEVLAKL